MKYIKHLAFPLAVLVFMLIGWFIIPIIDKTSGTYDLSFIHAFFAAIVIVTGITITTIYGLYFNFKDLYTSMYSSEGRTEFKSLPYLTKLVVALYVFSLVYLSTIVLYAIFV